MADYRSSLTGTQMDSALLDMAEHNSEAYAVGERNGIAVAPDDVTYHNNARYYAQIASSQIVGDASSAVRWDTDQSEALTDAQKAVARNNIGAASDSDVVKITSQTLTSAQQAQARANIMAGGSNRNLLDNPWFTVNQRGQSSYTNASGFSESVDRWKIANKTTLAVVSGGVTLTTTSEISLQQNTEYDLRGETVTASVKVGGVVYSGTTTVPSSGFNLVTLSINGLSVDVRVGYSSGLYFRINVNSNTASLTLQAVKLELGSVSTLANDAPPEYDTALWHCQRARWQNTGSYIMAASAVSATHAIVVMPLPNVLFKTPTLEQQGAFVLADRVNAGIAVTTIQLLSSDLQTCALLITTSGGLTRGITYGLALNGTGHLALNADL